jgi:ribosomal protein S18 acetylase RimI-like enzyme
MSEPLKPNSPDLSVRPISSADDGMLRALVEISMKGNEYPLDDEEKYAASWDHFANEFGSFDSDNELFLVVENDTQVIGFARAMRKPDEPGRWWVLGLEVREEHRRRGVAKRMLLNILNAVRQRGCSSVYSYTSKSNVASIRAHQSAGFRIMCDQFEDFNGRRVDHRKSWLMRIDTQ